MARRVIVAAGFESRRFIRPKLLTLKSSYVMITQPLRDFERWRDRSLIWETSRSNHYLRTTPDGRIMIGGADDPFSDARKRDALIPATTRHLRHQLERMFPDTAITPEFAWLGTFGDTEDGLPLTHGTPPDAYIAPSWSE